MEDLDIYFNESPELLNRDNTQSNRTFNNNYSNQNNYGQKKQFNRYPRKEKEVIDLNNFSLYKPISIVANNNVPDEVIEQFKQIADLLIQHKYTIRLTSGTNLDEVLLKQLSEDKPEIYIPWKDFNNIASKLYFSDEVAKHIAAMFHRSYDTLKPAVQAFLGRNVRMLLGSKMKSYSLAVITWSEDGAENTSDVNFKTGNISHIISVAKSLPIPVFNLQKPDGFTRACRYLKLKKID